MVRLAETERKVMDLVWDREGITAKELAEELNEKTGWNKTTTYTLINRCINKGYLRRQDPKFCCFSLVPRSVVAEDDTARLIDFGYQGKSDLLVAALVNSKKLTLTQLDAVYAALRQVEDDK